jgi:hypothetical protein
MSPSPVLPHPIHLSYDLRAPVCDMPSFLISLFSSFPFTFISCFFSITISTSLSIQDDPYNNPYKGKGALDPLMAVIKKQ